ncbi:MAG: PQQ-like beta-propeller repeat protein [Phycisphaerales bacterium]|nr:PQQ-like beta-propeller repeat protein [Phycisphaerales bacterium]
MFTAASRTGIARHTGLLVLAGLLAMTGCKSTSDSRTADSSSPRTARDASLLDALEREYAIGPRAARSLGYRLGWQAPDAGKTTIRVEPQGDSILVLSGDNILKRLTADTGTRLWSASVGSPVAEVLGLTYLPDQQRIYITRDSSILSLESATGVMTSEPGRSPVQELQWIANTAPVVFDDFLIYGSRAGELVWQIYSLGHSFRAYNIGQSVQLTPQLIGDSVIAVATSGEIVVLDAAQVSTRWRHKLLDKVVAEPGVGAEVVYVASRDQYLRAFDLLSGRLKWRALTEAPLSHSPSVIGRDVYQLIPGSGLACYEARPVNRYDGRRRWINPEITGTVLTKRGDNLITWDDQKRELALVSASTGVVETTVALPSVRMIVTDNQVNGRIYTLDDRGRLDCLIPAN